MKKKFYYVAGCTQSASIGQLYKVFCEAKKNGMCFFFSRLYCAFVIIRIRRILNILLLVRDKSCLYRKITNLETTAVTSKFSVD